LLVSVSIYCRSQVIYHRFEGVIESNSHPDHREQNHEKQQK